MENAGLYRDTKGDIQKVTDRSKLPSLPQMGQTMATQFNTSNSNSLPNL